MSGPTHADWESAREKRGEAATRFVWVTQGTKPNDPMGPTHDSEYGAAYLAEFYKWDAEMDRISAHIAGKVGPCNAARSRDTAGAKPCLRPAGHPGRHHDGTAAWGTL